MLRAIGLALGLLALLNTGSAANAEEELTRERLQELGYFLKALGFINEESANSRFSDAALDDGIRDFQTAFGFRSTGKPELSTFLIANRMNAWRSTDTPVALQHPTCTIFGARESIDQTFHRAARVLNWTGSCYTGKASGEGKLRIERHYRLSSGEARTVVDFYQGNMRAGFFDGNGKYFFFNGLSVTGRWEKGRAMVLDGTGAPAVSEIHGEALGRVKRALNQMGFKAGAEDAGFDKTAQKALRQFQSAVGIRPDGKLTRDMAIIVYRMQEWRTGNPIRSALFPVGGGSRKCEIYAGRRFVGGGVRLIEMTGSCPGGKPAGQIRLVVQDVVNLPNIKTTRQIYEGELNSGFYHGKGTYTFEDGTVINGRWANGKFLFQNEADPTDVRSIQQLLADRGYDPGPADGLMGTRTGNAIRAFQKDAGLKVDGQPTDTLLAQLKSSGGGAASTARRPDPGKGDAEAITVLQFSLNLHGYDAGPEDGKMGARTRKAIESFRRDWQLSGGTPDDDTVIGILFGRHPVSEPKWRRVEGSGCQVWIREARARQSFHWNGGCQGGKLHGKGRLTERYMLDGKWYERDYHNGEMRDGKRNGWGTFVQVVGNETNTYTGEWQDDERHGSGRLEYHDGRILEGMFRKGQFVGEASAPPQGGQTAQSKAIPPEKDSLANFTGRRSVTFANGARYDGEFLNGRINGTGTMTYSDGVVYSGQWVNGKRQGQGRLTMENGEYSGEFRNHQPNGRGEFRFRNGTAYSGEVVDGRYDGQGIISYPNGVRYEGGFVEGKRNGYGTLRDASGNVYKGEFRDNRFHGKGVLQFTSGDRYDGAFANDTFNGHGTYWFADGRWCMGIHENGRLVGWGTANAGGRMMKCSQVGNTTNFHD
ncbi:MAG: peptidoglycan-binding protein [Minwuia sp.]|uniref:peptidoglycan-binding protein n=1 Tax=Minwuia sp. TaxID=2493630 RepID=UPI003A86CF60